MIEKIKAFFAKKDKGETVAAAPEGMCPNCWGYNEWEGEYYQVVKKDVQSNNNNEDVYNNFINKVVEKHVESTSQQGNKYVCLTCDKEI
jgi:hypothetical protein